VFGDDARPQLVLPFEGFAPSVGKTDPESSRLAPVSGKNPGSNHLDEFTMLNLVEMGLPEEDRQAHLEVFAGLVMKAAKISDYQLETTSSEVYGTTVDIVIKGFDSEIGSAAMGPHVLDRPWGSSTRGLELDLVWNAC